ncbi:MAG: CpaF family protein [Firmicutes bacterium]|nr:CpaF family protein [Bacillota bacterium]
MKGVINPSFGYFTEKIKEKGGTLVNEQHLGKQDSEPLKAKVNQVIQGFDKDLISMKHDPKIREQLRQMIYDAVMQEGKNYPSIMQPALESLADEIQDEILGLGVITKFLDKPDVTEVMVQGRIVGPNKREMVVYYEKDGKLLEANVVSPSEEDVMDIIEKIGSPIGRRVDESTPYMDARLPDGSRVNAIIPPLALDGPSLTIRKFSQDPYTSDDLIKFGTFTPELAEFIQLCVENKLNLVISGGTGSGKTTTLNVLSSFIPRDERIVTIEDAAELQLNQPHIVRLESRPPNVEGKGAVVIRDLVRNALRMRPDRIVVGECRGGETLDMLQAMNTGHDGSLTTGHANSPRDMLSRLETMVLMAGMDLPVRAIREQISSAIDLILQQTRLRNGKRKITHVTAVMGIEGENIITQDLLVRKQGELVPAPNRNKFIPVLEDADIKIPSWIKEG